MFCEHQRPRGQGAHAPRVPYEPAAHTVSGDGDGDGDVVAPPAPLADGDLERDVVAVGVCDAAPPTVPEPDGVLVGVAARDGVAVCVAAIPASESRR